MDLHEAIRTQRAIRRLRPDPVDDQVLLRCAELTTRADGLGAALTTLPLWNRFAARRILDVPWNVEPVALIPVGWPRGRYGPTTRRPAERSVHVDRYGNRPFAGRSTGA